MAIPRKQLSMMADIVGKNNILTDIIDLETYAFDSSMYNGLPDVVILPETAAQVVAVMKLAAQFDIPLLPRGAGSSLSGGAVPVHGGIVLSLTKMQKILEIDLVNERIIVEPGIINLEVQKALSKYGYFFAPDPASMKISTIGGNIAENAGGMHCIKYGNTRDHILGLEVVLANGDVIRTGDMDDEYVSSDLTTLFCGSEGTFGIVTKAMLRLTRMSEKIGTLLAVFSKLDDAGNAVSQILANGVLPTSLEVMNDVITKSLVKYMNVDLPEGDATLLVEVEGIEAEMDAQMSVVRESFVANNAITFRMARDQEDRAKIWAARQGVTGIFGHLGSAQLVHDPSVPVDKIGEMMRETDKIGKKYNLIICQVCHAGDGNLHPGIMYDVKSAEQHEMAEKASDDILRLAISLGGNVSGEHGIGLEKKRFMSWQFNEKEISFMELFKRMFDPSLLLNRGKILNLESKC